MLSPANFVVQYFMRGENLNESIASATIVFREQWNLPFVLIQVSPQVQADGFVELSGVCARGLPRRRAGRHAARAAPRTFSMLFTISITRCMCIYAGGAAVGRLGRLSR